MKKYLPLLALLLSGCLPARKVLPTTEDRSIMLLQEDGRVVISSLNSAQQTKIIHQQQAGDTLLVAYKTWVPLFRREYSAAESTVPLTAQIRYVKCANRRYRVVQAAGGFRLEQL